MLPGNATVSQAFVISMQLFSLDFAQMNRSFQRIAADSEVCFLSSFYFVRNFLHIQFFTFALASDSSVSGRVHRINAIASQGQEPTCSIGSKPEHCD